MGMAKESLILYSLDLLLNNELTDKVYYKEQLALSLDISDRTLDLYLSKMKKERYIERTKKHYVSDLDKIVRITSKGEDKLDEIKENIQKELLTPERHNSPTCVSVSVILKRMRDPLERIFFLSLYFRNKSFDLPTYIQTMKEVKSDFQIVKVLSEMENDGSGQGIPLVDTFFKTRYYGKPSAVNLDDGYFDRTDPNNLLIVAEASYKQGRFTDSRTIYEYLLSDKINLNQNQWFIAKTGLALLTSKEGDVEEAIYLLNDIIKRTDNKIYHSYAKQLIARIYSNIGEHEKSLKLYNEVINSFRTLGIPIMCAIAYNNRGVLYYRMRNYDKAEENWLIARKYITEAGVENMLGPVYGNLSDIEIIKGNLEKSEKYLKDAMKIYEDSDNYEEKSYMEYNYSLHYLAKGDLKKALEYFKRSETIAYPFPSPPERMEKRRTFKERALEAGFDEPWIYELDNEGRIVEELSSLLIEEEG